MSCYTVGRGDVETVLLILMESDFGSGLNANLSVLMIQNPSVLVHLFPSGYWNYSEIDQW